VSLIYTPFMLRMMGQSEYGLYGMAGSFISYLSLLSFGIGGAYVKFNAQYRAKGDVEGEKKLNGMFFSVFAVLAGLVGIVGAILIACSRFMVSVALTSEESTKLQIIMGILVINTIGTFIGNVVTMALNAYERYFFVRSVLLACGVITPILNVVALYLGGRAIALAAISCVVSLSTYVVFFVYARASINLQFSLKGFDKKVLKDIFVFSAFLFVNSLTDTLTFSTDSIILGTTKGTACVAVYTVGSQFKNYFHQFSTTVSNVFAPAINMNIAKGGDMGAIDDLFVKVGRIQFYVVSLVLIGYCSIGHQFIRLWAGENYSDAFWIGLFLMLSVFIPAFQSIGVQIQQAMNKHKARSITYFLIALINVGITIPFSIWWGGIGAALATMICMLAGCGIFMNIYYVVKIKLDIKGFWIAIAKTLPGMIIPIATGIVVNRFWNIDSYIDVILSALILIVVYIASVWFFSMNQYEKQLFSKPIKRIFNRKGSEKNG